MGKLKLNMVQSPAKVIGFVGGVSGVALRLVELQRHSQPVPGVSGDLSSPYKPGAAHELNSLLLGI